jgi:HTH-type transcriptional regulator/antitoxin MqsA
VVRHCSNCEDRNGLIRFENEDFTIGHAGTAVTVEALSGWRCVSCGDVKFDAGSARRYAAAGDALVLGDRERQSKEIRRIRRKLGLSQVAAARLTGGGHNAVVLIASATIRLRYPGHPRLSLPSNRAR